MFRKSVNLRRIPAIIMIQNSETDGAAYLGHFQKSLLNTNLRLVHFKMFNKDHLRLLPQSMSVETWRNQPFYCTHAGGSLSTPSSASSSANATPRPSTDNARQMASVDTTAETSSTYNPLPACVMSPCDADCEHKMDYHVVGVISLGGPMCAADDEGFPFIRKVMTLMKSAVEEDVPVLGICLGSQMLSRALGGEVTESPIAEKGFIDQEVDPIATFSTPQEAAASKANGIMNWFAGRKTLPTYHWHGDTFTIPKGAVRIASGKYCVNQAFQIPHKYVLGIQWHPDIDNRKAVTWCRQDGIDKVDRAEPLTPGVVTVGEFLDSLADGRQMAETQSLADDIYQQWFEGVFQCKETRVELLGAPAHEDRDVLLSPPLGSEVTSPIPPARLASF